MNCKNCGHEIVEFYGNWYHTVRSEWEEGARMPSEVILKMECYVKKRCPSCNHDLMDDCDCTRPEPAEKKEGV